MGEAKGCPGQRRKGTLTQPGWQILGPSTGGKKPPAEAFHPPGQRGALGRGGGYEIGGEGQGSGSGPRRAGVTAPRTGPCPQHSTSCVAESMFNDCPPGKPRAKSFLPTPSLLPAPPVQPKAPAPPSPPPSAYLQPRLPACQVRDLTGQTAAGIRAVSWCRSWKGGREGGREGRKEGGERGVEGRARRRVMMGPRDASRERGGAGTQAWEGPQLGKTEGC